MPKPNVQSRIKTFNSCLIPLITTDKSKYVSNKVLDCNSGRYTSKLVVHQESGLSVFVVLGITPRTSCMQGKNLYPSSISFQNRHWYQVCILPTNSRHCMWFIHMYDKDPSYLMFWDDDQEHACQVGYPYLRMATKERQTLS